MVGVVLLAALAALPESSVAAADAVLLRAHKRLEIPGLSAAAALGTDVVYTRSLGLADRAALVPAGDDTVYRIASLAKPITATAVMQLVEQGRLDLDAPVQRYVPAYPEKPWPVTARLLLAHQGGLRHLASDEWGSTRHYASVAQALQAFKDEPLAYEPGTRCLYSSYGYCLLGNVVEGASTSAYADYLRAAILGPAGMAATGVDDALAPMPHRARGYVRRRSGEIIDSIPADTSNKIPAGGLVSTATDMARFGAALLSGRLVKPETLALMTAPQRTRDGRGTAYGLGFRVSKWKGRSEAWQHGGQPQVSTLLYLWPERRVAVVILCNLEGVSPDLLEVAREMAVAVFHAPGATLTPPGKGR